MQLYTFHILAKYNRPSQAFYSDSSRLCVNRPVIKIRSNRTSLVGGFAAFGFLDFSVSALSIPFDGLPRVDVVCPTLHSDIAKFSLNAHKVIGFSILTAILNRFTNKIMDLYRK